MEQTVYGDILFFVNFCMDFQCLFLTARLLHRPFSVWRGAVFSALGALYACAALFLSSSGTVAFLADCGVCWLMCVGVFYGRERGMRRVLLPFLLYFGVSMALGGVMSGTATLLSKVDLPPGSGRGQLSSVGFFLLAALGGAATLLWGRLCQRRAKGRRAELTLTMEGKSRSFRCLVDTGNLLRDPVSGRPVALIDKGAARALLPEAVLAVVGERDARGLTELPRDLVRRTRLIPAGTATGEGMLVGVLPDRAVLDTGKGGTEVALLIAPVALCASGEDYDVLLPAALITE